MLRKNLCLLAFLVVMSAPAFAELKTEVNHKPLKSNNMQIQAKAITDEELSLSVKEAIMADKDLAKYGDKVEVKAEKGVVTLSGEVADEKAKSDLELKVKSLPGVDEIENNIEVVPDM